MDIDKYSRTPNNTNVVKDLTDAEFVLYKYGYLMCSQSRQKREVLHSRRMHTGMNVGKEPEQRSLWSGLQEGVGADGCKEAEVQKAILNYQSTYNLPLTGKLDEETMNLMSTSRCGNKDSEEEDAVSSSEQNGDNDVHSATSNTDSNNSETDSGNTDDSGANRTSHRLWRRSAYLNKSRIFSVLLQNKNKNTARTLNMHRQYLKNFIERERLKQMKSGRDAKTVNKRWRSLLLKRYTSSERRKRSVHPKISKRNLDPAMLFNKEEVTWRLLTTGLSTRIPLIDQRASIDMAFRMWSEVIPLTFKEDNEGDIHSVDIEIAFGKGSHQNCEHDFDGNGGEIAHSWNVGDMHFDDDESFRSIGSAGADGIYLLRVAVHEIGHVLGLAHTNKSHSIMYAIYRGAQLESEFELNRSDRKDIQEIYGVCKGSFNTVFDWVRNGPHNRFIYNTYFFRRNHYWMYENHANRTRYGDPLFVAREWSGLPDDLDGYVHVWIFSSGKLINDAYFFKGEYYYKYDSYNDTVVKSWPRLISEDFGPKPGQSVGIPNNIDSVFFDSRDGNSYFFKDNDVYVFDPVAPPEERGCCVRKTSIQEEFPAASGQRPLPSHLDAVYYSYKDKMQYFFKGDDYWRNKLYDPRQRRTNNLVEYMGKWYDKWFDICDVQEMNEL